MNMNEQITLELLEKEKIDPEFKQAIKERHANVIVYFAEWILGDVLEVGCRHGVLLEMIERCKEILPRVRNTYGIDMSHEAIEMLKSKGLAGAVQTAETLLDSVALYGMFDTIFCLHTLEHCTDIPKVISGLWECLRPGGYVLIEIPLQPKEPTPTVWGHYHCFETEQELIDMFSEFEHIITFREPKHTWRRFVFKK